MNPITKLIAAILFSAVILVWATSNSDAAFPPAPLPIYATTYLPANVYDSCTISTKKFDSWFVGNKAKVNNYGLKVHRLRKGAESPLKVL